MSGEQASCRRCDTSVPGETTVCPSCGYDVAQHDRARLWLGAFGTVLTLSVVFAPIGLLFLWGANRQRIAAEGSVAYRPDRGLPAHLRAVVGAFLGAGPTANSAPEASAEPMRSGE